MKMRRHHNNTGERRIRRGRTREDVERMSKRLKVPLAQDVPTMTQPVDKSRRTR